MGTLFLQNPVLGFTGETKDVKVVRTFYTHRAGPEGQVSVWHADPHFVFFEHLSQRVAEWTARRIEVQVRSWEPRTISKDV